MKKATTISILSFAIFCSLFFPLFEWHSFEMNGLNYILSTHIPSYKYFLLPIPLATAFLFFGALNDDNYFFDRRMLSWIPFLSLVFLFIMRYLKGSSENNYPDVNLLSAIEPGFWLCLFFSLSLALVKDKNNRAKTKMLSAI